MQNKHGGKREGAKRPPLYGEAMKRKEVMLPDEAIEFFLALGNGNLSAGVRQAWRSLTKRAPDKWNRPRLSNDSTPEDLPAPGVLSQPATCG